VAALGLLRLPSLALLSPLTWQPQGTQGLLRAVCLVVLVLVLVLVLLAQLPLPSLALLSPLIWRLLVTPELLWLEGCQTLPVAC